MSPDVPPITIRPARLRDAQTLAPRLRGADCEEVMASSGVTPLIALRRSLRASLKESGPGGAGRAWAGLVGDELVCVWGVAPASDGTGIPWLLGSDGIETHQRAFLRRNRAYLAEMEEGRALLCNRVDARNTASKAWLAWLGFTLEPAAAYGPHGVPFHFFWKRTAHGVPSQKQNQEEADEQRPME